MDEANLQALMAPKYWEALEKSEALDFQIGYTILKTPLLALENDF